MSAFQPESFRFSLSAEKPPMPFAPATYRILMHRPEEQVPRGRGGSPHPGPVRILPNSAPPRIPVWDSSSINHTKGTCGTTFVTSLVLLQVPVAPLFHGICAVPADTIRHLYP